MSKDILSKFNKFLYGEIPLTKDMQLKIEDISKASIKTQAPLSNNINDKGSVFGGSSSALMIISAWSLIKLKCLELKIDADIVIHKNETVWHKALYSDLIIEAKFSKTYDFNNVKKAIDKKRHQRIDCQIYLKDNDANIFSTMTAKYVIIPK